MDQPILPRTIIGYVIGKSGVHQLGLATLSAAVFGLSAVPARAAAAHRQRRDQERSHCHHFVAGGRLRRRRGSRTGLQASSQRLSWWVSEDAVRNLRQTIQDAGVPVSGHETDTRAPSRPAPAPQWPWPRSEPIGGFVGTAISGAAVAGRHPGERDRLYDLPGAVDPGAVRDLRCCRRCCSCH